MFDELDIPEELAAQIGELAQSPLTFAEGLLLNPEDLAPFEANPPQQQILSATQRDVWFCLVGTAKILHPITLRPTRIDECYGVQETLVFDFHSNEVVWGDAQWIKQPEKKQCQKFKFASGNSLSLSTDHQVFSRNRGWVEARELRIGDQVLAPSAVPVFGKLEITRLQASNLAELTNLNHHFPDQVFQLTEQSLKHFLAEYWMIQGRLFPDKEICIFFTNNREMAEDLHHLLLRYGVDSLIDEDNNVFIVDPIDLPVFLNVIGIAAPILDVRAKRRWEIISEVRKIGFHEVYDLAVEHPDHNFLANDVVVHNCVHRRAGKSFSLVILAIWHAMTKSNRKVTLFAPSQIQVDEFFKTLDLFFNTNPLVRAAQAPVGNTKAPYQIRTFITGSTITGFPLGVTGGAQEGKRGVGSDVIIVDEAHLLTDEDWRVVNPIMRGDFYRQGRIRCYIAGTIVEQTGWFYKKIFELPETKTSKVLKIPITDNPQWTEEMVEDIKANTPEHEWLTEWMLQPTSANTAVFRMEDIDRSCRDYAYHCPAEGVDLISPFENRYLTVDWDKYQAGTNICVTQYNPGTQELKLIYRTEIPRSQFTYMEACNRVLDLFVEYRPSLVLTDQGAGEMQWEYLVIEGDRAGLDFSSKTIKVAYQSVIEVPDLEDPANGLIKKQMKHFLIGLLARRFQEGKIIIPYDDIDLKNQLYMYKVLKQTKSQPIFGTQERSAKSRGPTYTSKDEHIIDCLAFACLGAYLEWENVLSPSDQLSEVHQMSNAPSEPLQQVGQSAMWAELDGISPQEYDFGPLRHYSHRSSF